MMVVAMTIVIDLKRSYRITLDQVLSHSISMHQQPKNLQIIKLIKARLEEKVLDLTTLMILDRRQHSRTPVASVGLMTLAALVENSNNNQLKDLMTSEVSVVNNKSSRQCNSITSVALMKLLVHRRRRWPSSSRQRLSSQPQEERQNTNRSISLGISMKTVSKALTKIVTTTQTMSSHYRMRAGRQLM